MIYNCGHPYWIKAMTFFDDTDQKSFIWDWLFHVVLWHVVCRKENYPLKTSQLPSTSLDVTLHARVWVLVLMDAALYCLFSYYLYNTLHSFQNSFSVFFWRGGLACTFQPFKQLYHKEATWSARSHFTLGKVIQEPSMTDSKCQTTCEILWLFRTLYEANGTVDVVLKSLNSLTPRAPKLTWQIL